MPNHYLKFLCIFVLMLGVSACASSTHQYVKNQERFETIRTIAVVPFTCQETTVGVAIADGLTANLLNTNWTLLGELQFRKLLQDQGLQLDSTMNYGTLLGKVKGVDAIITGSASIFIAGGEERSVSVDRVTGATAQLIDLKSGEIIAAATYSPGHYTSPSEIGEELALTLRPHWDRW